MPRQTHHEEGPNGKMKQLVDRGLRAQLETQSFVTGQLQIAFDFFPDKSRPYVSKGISPRNPNRSHQVGGTGQNDRRSCPSSNWSTRSSCGGGNLRGGAGTRRSRR